jgi:catalase
LFAYPDAARYRVGANYQQLPTNAAISAVYSPYERDGFMSFRGNYGPDPNYVRSSLRPLNYGPASIAHDQWIGNISAFSSEITDEDFVQPRAMWEMFGRTGQQESFVQNLSGHLKSAIPEVQKETISGYLRLLGTLPC